MSKRNSQASKQAARERIRAQQEAERRREKRKRSILVGASILGVLAIAGGVSYAVVQNNKPGYWDEAKDKKLVKPANTTGENGTTVVVGKASAKKTLKVYEDPRCPVCASFEQAVGPTVEKDLKEGKYKVQFIGATFLDRNLPGEGSRNAMSALGAALNVSPDAFLAYKKALYSADNHPNEQEDKFKDDDLLLKIANEVPELKKSAAFKKAVEDGTYDRWALEMSKTFDDNKDGVEGTPAFVMNGKQLKGADGKNAPMSVQEFDKAVGEQLKA
ncbi:MULTISPECIES: thioredoxin domain-containing protein [Streptomyces]|uniref:Disulfide bond formation protein DsbA n=2 Tax=Streptomyces TaxID=1883 RepID=A0A0W7WTN3_9ACTN|nr:MULTISPECIES: thioredoxin domain-containing protein [Streptomyces]KUF13942.1 disulfide bond formation protein DsbA [Streptomyces silvensis]MVO89002.1 thioredoxin domain-containing protein [Streptomyces typhae]